MQTRLYFERPHLIPLEETGLWFGGQDGAQRRIGGRMALAARLVDAPFGLWVVTLHLESKTDPKDRQQQVRALLTALDGFAAGEACIVGGDFNTKAMPADDTGLESGLREAERFEPLFEEFRREGFTWTSSNIAAVTQRTGPSGAPGPPFRKLDWLFVRGVSPTRSEVVPALDPAGRALSDHEMVVVQVSLEPPEPPRA